MSENPTLPSVFSQPVFITGGSGFIGQELVRHMESKKIPMHLLLRSGHTIETTLPTTKVFQGDILDQSSLLKAMQGCGSVIHLASFVDIWSKNPSQFYEVNVEGTMNVCSVALECGIRRLLQVSTAGILGTSPDDGSLNDEDSYRKNRFMNHYESSKFMGEERSMRFLQSGLDVVIVYPPRVFGHGQMCKSNGYTTVIDQYRKGKLRFIPGTGNECGNYVFIDDLIMGILLALEKGMPGRRYIIGGHNVSFRDFFRAVARVTGKEYSMIPIPSILMMAFARISMGLSFFFGSRPVLTPAYVARFRKSYRLSIARAQRELGYFPSPLDEGIKKTIDWLESRKK